MSEMQRVEMGEMNDMDCLIGALKDIGYKHIVYNEAKEFDGYGEQKRKAHIVIGKEQFRGMANAGFERREDGSFILHVDDYDWGKHGKRFKLDKIKQNYQKNKVKKMVNSSSQYHIVEEKEVDGSIKMRISLMEF